jgi:tripartite-type tricarboxylate transporter receptor subunit TctC
MKNRKREICTSGSVRDEAGQPPHLLGHRRQVLHLAAGAAAFPTVSRIAWAQIYPARPVTLVVPYPAGTATDTTMRALGTATEKYLGRPIVIENRPGAGGALGPGQVATARPDGYTLSQIPLPVFRAFFLRKMAYDPSRDFTYIIGITGYTYGVVVRSDSPWKTFQELLADAKRDPGKINFGTPGANTTQHVTMLQIARQQGINWTHVPFKGTPEMVSALLGGHIDVSADTTAWGPQVNAGQLRLLVTFGAGRTKSWPTVPTLQEVGINLVANSPYGLAGPKDMDPMIVKILHDAFQKGMQEPAFGTVMTELDQEFLYRSTGDYRADVTKQIAEQKRLVEELGLKNE